MTTHKAADTMTCSDASNPAPTAEAREPAVPIGPAGSADLEGLIDLLQLRPPTSWILKIPRPALTRFLHHSVTSRRAVVLLARPPLQTRPGGYIFAITDPRRFWIDFAARHPADALAILFYRSRRILQLRRAAAARSAGLPPFSWSPSSPRVARILGLCVHPSLRRRGIAMDLYFRLFDALRAMDCTRVEEYMGADYSEYAGKFPEVCGWQPQRCDRGGYKITRDL